MLRECLQLAGYAFHKLEAANQNNMVPGADAGSFSEIIELKNADRLAEALERVYDHACDNIRAPFDRDLNCAWYVIADIYCRQRRFDLAQRAFERALIAWPDDVDALIGLAQARCELGLTGAAQHALMAALEINPFDERVLFNLANTHLECEDYEDAIILYERLITTGSTLTPLAKKNIAVAIERTGVE